MDEFRLAVQRVEAGYLVSVPHVNGQSLIKILREIELPFASDEGSPSIAGAYQGIPLVVAFLPSRHLLGESALAYDGTAGRIAVLQCKCGLPGCWPFEVRVGLTSEKVTWTDYIQPHRRDKSKRWTYEALPPFEFVRRDYEAQLVPPDDLPEGWRGLP